MISHWGLTLPRAWPKSLVGTRANSEKMLEQMSADGLIFEAKAESGEPEYSVLAFEPGLVEMQFLKGKDDERTRKFVRMFNQVHEEETALLEGLLEQPEVVKEMFKFRRAELLPLKRMFPATRKLRAGKDSARSLKTRIPTRWVNVGANTLQNSTVSRARPMRLRNAASGSARWPIIWWKGIMQERYTKEELYKLMKNCEEAGLVHFTSNRTVTDNIVMCNCCKCCCLYLRTNKRIREAAGVQLMETTNFLARVDEETCTGCGDCVELCSLEAMELSGDTVSINEEFCVGCGVCVSTCPTESLSLVRVSRKKPPELTLNIVGSGV